VRFAPSDAENALAIAARYDVMVLGPGLGPGQEVLVAEVATGWDGPLLIDADGLNALDDLRVLAGRERETVVTPHAGEFERLTGLPANPAATGALVDDAGVVVLLKGSPTLVAGADSWLVNSGGSELATIGTGDVLAGAIGALWARGLAAEVAARSGAFWHGMAGADLRGSGAFAASELAQRLACYAGV